MCKILFDIITLNFFLSRSPSSYGTPSRLYILYDFLPFTYGMAPGQPWEHSPQEHNLPEEHNPPPPSDRNTGRIELTAAGAKQYVPCYIHVQ